MSDLVTRSSMERLAVLELRAVQLISEGYSVRQVADQLDIGEPHVRSLLALRQPCHIEGCGQPREGAGRPRRGWVQIKCGNTRPWFCSYRCAARWLGSQVTT